MLPSQDDLFSLSRLARPPGVFRSPRTAILDETTPGPAIKVA
ncbi:hypothetical protein PACID_00980 [Acidipropionibacterium acidipropionici ATCC 4875]|uniref:Uncharacterized protein n=1 Tax=Acidipropionibacterium acidipropionici (strain ATCC 4875 / DSM 20272 / JCM 6432 / NBRC 12425 / NCIMB 8070 / 4) TaxID=1171373 RepID=K7RJ79_ACIA4|nr:hypothetical protein PACID_00980 [Acidipropionibacterium acidipropionici ATCC 4875]